MNPFDQQLRAAKKKQRLLFISLAASFLAGLLIIIAVVLVSRGTRLEIQPEAAAISSRLHVDQGLAFIISETLYSISKNPVISASADGFKLKRKTLNDDDFGKVMNIVLEPLPAKVELKTNIVDENVSWIINGTKVAVSNAFEYELDAGEYELTILHPYYKETKAMLSLTRGEVLKKTFELNAIEGKLNINSLPEGANVSINMKDSGVTPLTLPLSGGLYQVTVSHKNYDPIEDNIEISNTNSEINRDYRLELKKAVVEFTLKPEGGELSLDGIVVKQTKSLAVEAGVKHRLVYSKKGYFSASKEFNITADEKKQLSFNLKKEIGQLEIVSSPDAEVFVNDKFVGNTPVTLSLDAVEQKITLNKQGYRSVTKTIIPSSSNNKKISVTLLPEKVVRLQEAPDQYTNKVGGKLKLFKPDDTFTMGAKRSEPGQRANEFVKKVKLSKAFYAGIYEVSNAEYMQFDSNKKGKGNEPVTSVSWIDAALYCNWLSKLEGLNSFYDIRNKQLLGVNTESDGYRLLTEAEWEWLARKAGKSERTTFVWGDESIIPKGAVNVADESAKGKVKVFVSKYNDGFAGVAPVGSFAVEDSGLYDQGGNVSEWTNSSYSIVIPDANKVFQDPVNSSMGSTHVIKGANFRSGSITELRPAYREGISEARDDLGFRIGRYVYGGN